MPTEHCFAGTDPWCDALVSRINELVLAALAMRGSASLVVSGGSTPVPLFRRLALAEWPWENVHITLADERWVASNSEHSNEGLVRSNLLSEPAAAAARFTGLYNGAALPGAACEEIAANIAALPRPFDVVLLGIGDDGHTASLFPGQRGTRDAFAESSVCVANEAPQEPRQRISLGPGALLDARQIIFHLRGAAKWDVYQAALKAPEPASMPAAYFLTQQQVPVDVYWTSR